MATNRIPWQPRYLEIIRTVTDRQYKDIMGAQDSLRTSPKRDFLTNAGYTRSPKATRSSPIRAFDGSGGRQATIESCWHLYYWCRLSEAP